MSKFINKRGVILVIVLISVLTLSACSGQKAASSDIDYPKGNIEALVGWGAGGGTDTFARSIMKPAGDILKTNIVIVNQEGASGAIAGDLVSKAKPDGYTLWAISSNYPLNVALGKTPHDLSKYIPVCRIQNDIGTIQTLSGGKYNTLEKLIEAAKANPGDIKLGGTGALGFDDIIVSMWENEAGVEFNYVPYESAGQMHTALLGGHIDAMFEELGPTIGLIQEGRITPVLAFAENKIEEFPDLPIAPDMGWNVTEGQSRGILVPAGTPEEIVRKLEQTFLEAKSSESYKKYEKDSYLHLRDGWLGSEDFKKQLEESIEMYKKVLEEIQ
ncbi:tripartite tricarboxylate transporter substrate binding protein [Proteiniborus sp.]|uniref:tripartite tricarboxylate transporter substrate binding protein n=1 Tax=Proteiniborus sp. TaxID=2079015 RepID=UPI003316CDCA